MFEAVTPVTEEANNAYDAIRALCRETVHGPLPGPHLYSLLGNLKYAGGHGLADLLANSATGLRDSLTKFDVYEDDGADPADRTEEAATLLLAAAVKAREIGALLESAQSAISRQGYRDGTETQAEANEDEGDRGYSGYRYAPGMRPLNE